MKQLLIDLAKNIDDNRYVVFETKRCKCYFDLQKVAAQEMLFVSIGKFDDPLFLSNIKRKRKRTRTMI